MNEPQSSNMVGHKVIAQSAACESDWSVEQQCRIPYRKTIEGQLLAWNADGTVFVKVDNHVVRCLGEGMEFVE